jgi:hypothetical protein
MEGDCEGAEEGAALAEGCIEGAALALTEGAAVGAAEGAGVGLGVGRGQAGMLVLTWLSLHREHSSASRGWT